LGDATNRSGEGTIGDTGWRWWFLIAWAGFAVSMLAYKWAGIHWFALGDTDDNMRIAQVRALLDGQGWYDLRQYRLDPPGGASIHWSRLVDLPIAGLILAAKPFVGVVLAEKFAVAAAPLLALGAALYALMLAARRLIRHDLSFAMAAAILACAQSPLLMWMPLRIDHHGWQLAFLALLVAGIADRKAVRGGVTAGLATALSLVIGLELLPYLAVAGASFALRWIWDRGAAERMRAYGIALAGGCAAGFAGFASYDNRALVCDVLSPVYLATMLAAGAALMLLGSLSIERRALRLALAGVAGAVLAAGFALAFPQCLGRPEQISPELERLWFQYINEAKPLWQHGFRTYLPTLTLPVIGTVGALAALWRERTPAWATVAALAATGLGLLFWQTRAGPAAQLLAVPGAAWLGCMILPRLMDSRHLLVRVFGSVGGFIVISGLVTGFVLEMIPEPPKKPARVAVNKANRKCPTLPAMGVLNRLPPTTILSFVDLGPRLIVATHHKAIAGPYHRNGAAILDIHRSFRSTDPEVAHAVMRRHGATLLLLCPGLSESTLYATQDPKGFYRQLRRGQVPAWLEPVPLPKWSPFQLWRRVD
jgi:hypothetical protein